MPEIFVPEEPVDPAIDEVARLQAAVVEMLAIAEWAEWLTTQSETIQALAQEWIALRGSRFSIAFNDALARWEVRSPHGFHWSRQSAERALFEMVDCHRTRVEDTPEYRARVRAAYAGMTEKEALRRCEQIGQSIRVANPRATGEERDTIAMLYLEELEKRAAEPLVPVEERDVR